ncbi:MAG TPA: ankyrin repeat domain-containing protein, partial [Verrucomicrobiae bacterium]|nr:ankyrin repeat domain-containing protein [Verrucomicrobiae bacterium]
MKTKFCLLVVLLAAVVAHAQTNLTMLLQQGLFEEQANRNLDAAIADYQTLATQFDKDRQIAATAIFRLGECYRMEGNTNEAALEYQRIMREFPDQKSLVTLSQQDLAGIGATASEAAPANSNANIWNKVKDLPESELEKVLPTLVPDPVLTSLLQKRDDAGTKLVELRTQFGPDYPEITEQIALLSEINRQISDRINGMMQALKIQYAETTPAESAVPTGEEDREIQRIQQMIQNSPDLINAPDSSGITPLENAAMNGQLKVAAYLLDHGADVNLESRGQTPLIMAASHAQKTMVDLLLSRGADANAADGYGATALVAAASHGFEAVVQTLLAHHADVNRQDDGGATALCLAASSGRLNIVQMLIAAGAKTNLKDNQGRTALNYAIATSPEIIQALLAAGTGPNTEDSQGRTPLSYAAERDTPGVVKLMLDAKADPNGGTRDAPLLCAINKYDTASAGLLLQAGSNPNLKGVVDPPYQCNGYNQATPLWTAVSMNQLPMVQLLLKYKADPNDSQIDNTPVIF